MTKYIKKTKWENEKMAKTIKRGTAYSEIASFIEKAEEDGGTAVFILQRTKMFLKGIKFIKI